MRGELVVFGAMVLVLGLGAQACGAPVDNPAAPGSAAAEATSVSRTAIADVQRIIANNPTPTEIPTPAPTATPSCPDAIWWLDARSHIGESRTVQGTVVGTRPAPGGLALLAVGQPYPDPTGLAVLVPAAGADALQGETVCVTGKITRIEGSPTIQLRDTSSVTVIGTAP